MVKFCDLCGSFMKKEAAEGTITFICSCQTKVEGTAEDTLMAEENFNPSDDTANSVFIENSPYDLAANIVLKDCQKCKLNYMAMIRVGENESTMYTCRCGFVTN